MRISCFSLSYLILYSKLVFTVSLDAEINTSLVFLTFSHSRRAHQWKDCRLRVLSLCILPSLCRPHKARKAHQLYQPCWRWSRIRSECPLGLQANKFAFEPWISGFTVFFLLLVRTLEEQQQQTKPSAAVSDPLSVATAPTYVDSPRKVSIVSMYVDQNKLFYTLIKWFFFAGT